MTIAGHYGRSVLSVVCCLSALGSEYISERCCLAYSSTPRLIVLRLLLDVYLFLFIFSIYLYWGLHMASETGHSVSREGSLLLFSSFLFSFYHIIQLYQTHCSVSLYLSKHVHGSIPSITQTTPHHTTSHSSLRCWLIDDFFFSLACLFLISE